MSSRFTFSDVRYNIQKYNDFVNILDERKNRVCIGTCVGAVWIWCYRQFAPEYLPSVAALCVHSVGNYSTVYQWLGSKTLYKLFPDRNLKHAGYRGMMETGFYMALDYAVIKWLSPHFIPALHKYIIRIRYASFICGSVICLAIGSLYIPRVQNFIVKRLANTIRQTPQLRDLVRTFSGMTPTGQTQHTTVIDRKPTIPYSKFATPVPDNAYRDELTSGICMQDAETIINTDKTHLTKLNTCGHLFCIPCIETWLNIGSGGIVQQAKYCPMCRSNILPLSEIPEPQVTEPASDGLEDHLRYIFANFRI